MDDLISRQAAIDTVDEALTRVFVEHRDIAEKMINKIPSAQPEPKKGRWIRLYYNRPRSYTRICSECREICWFCGIGDYNYCPNCGAGMRGEEDE